MTELEALRRVAEAARKWRDWQAHSQMMRGEYAFYSGVSGALIELDALPAPAAEPEGEVGRVVQMQFVPHSEHNYPSLFVLTECGRVLFKTWKGDAPAVWKEEELPARVPLPRVPEVVGEVG